MSLEAAADRMVGEIRDDGLLEAVHEPLAAAYVALGRELDRLGRDDQGKAAMFREFRNYHDALTALGGEDGDSIDDLLAQLSSSVGNHPAPRPANQG